MLRCCTATHCTEHTNADWHWYSRNVSTTLANLVVNIDSDLAAFAVRIQAALTTWHKNVVAIRRVVTGCPWGGDHTWLGGKRGGGVWVDAALGSRDAAGWCTAGSTASSGAGAGPCCGGHVQR